MERTYEALLEENSELRKALGSTKELVERFRSDNDSLKRMHEDFKLHHERLKKECSEAQQRCSDAVAAKKETESYYENYVKRMKNSIEQRKKEFDEMQAKMIPPVDSELLRVKLVNEIEGPMRVAIENKQEELLRYIDSLNELNRKYELVQVEYSTYKAEIEREIRDSRDRHSSQLAQYFREMEEMQHKIDDPADKDAIRALKKERDELRLKNSALMDEVEDIRKSRETMKNSMHELKGQFSKEIDEERNKTRSVRIEMDKVALSNKDLSEQLSKKNLGLDTKNNEVASLKKDLDSLKQDLESAESANEYTREEINNLHRKLQEKDSQIDAKVREVTKSEREKAAKLKEEKERLHKQLEDFELREREYRSNASSSEKTLKHEIDLKTSELQSLKEDNKLIENRNALLTKELEALKQNYSSKVSEYDKIAYEASHLREKISDLNNREVQLVATKQKLEDTLGKAHGNRPDYQGQKGGDVQQYKNKVREYKARLRQANEKIQELGLKLMHSEIERQKKK